MWLLLSNDVTNEVSKVFNAFNWDDAKESTTKSFSHQFEKKAPLLPFIRSPMIVKKKTIFFLNTNSYICKI